jgi:putative cardiolipin synthase
VATPRPFNLLALVLGLLALLAGGCASLPEEVDRPASKAMAMQAETALGRIAKNSTVDRELSGFRLMPTGQFALQARIELALRAERTLDVQYYQIHNDQTGRFLLRTMRDASLRGVRVRLILDDLYTAGEDELLLALDAYPNVEIRLFNPFPAGRKSLLTRFTANAHEFNRVHRRMHNKLFIADGAMAVAGGRNIADEYFMASKGANFVDLDLFVIGAILPRLSFLFDEYWNSPRVYPLRAIVGSDKSDEALQQAFEELTSADAAPPEVRAVSVNAEAGLTKTIEVEPAHEGTPEPEAPPPNDVLGYSPIVQELDAGKLGLIWANAQAYADNPDKVIGRVSTYGGVPIDDVDSVRYNVIEMVRRARKDVVITSPYLVPGLDGMETFAASTKRGVRFTLVTNSLAATDEPVVHTGYRRYRPQMLGLGMELYELSPQKVSRSLRLGRFSTSIGRLHAKSAVVDQKSVFIGSMNFDPRSDQHNTEMGLFIESPAIAAQVLKLVGVIRQQGAYRVTLAENGKDLVWTTTIGGEQRIVEEPETDIWSRMMLEVLSVLVPEGLL